MNKTTIKGNIHAMIQKIIEIYNKTYHRIIGMSPNDANNPKNFQRVKENNYKSRIRENTKFLLNGDWPVLNVGDDVVIKDELRKSKKGTRFKSKAIVIENLGFNTYKLQKENKKLLKRHISQIKKL